MKSPLVITALLLMQLLAPAGPRYTTKSHPAPDLVGMARLRPLRVVRTPAVARQHRQVRAVR